MIEGLFIAGVLLTGFSATVLVVGATVALFTPDKPVAGFDDRSRLRRYLDRLDEV